LGDIALSEVDGQPRLAGVLGGYVDESAADVVAADLKSQPCHLDGQVPRAESDLEHARAGREAGGDLGSLFPVGVELALRATDAGVPPGDRSLHLGAVEPPASRFGHLHLISPLHLTLLGVWCGTIHLTPLGTQAPLQRLEENSW